MEAPQAAVGYRLQLAATYLTIRVWVGVASLLVLVAIALLGSMVGAWYAAGVVAADLALNLFEARRPHPRAVVSLVSLATMFGLLGLIIRVPVLIGSSLVFIIVVATVITTLLHAILVIAYSAAWTLAGLLVLREYGPPGSGSVSSFVADAASIAAFAAATFVFVAALTRRLDLLDRLRNRLISSVSHELRTPLTGLHGLATVLQDKYDELSQVEVAEFLDLLVLESAEATALVEDLLTAVRPTEYIRLEVQSVDIAAQVATVVATLAPSMSKSAEVTGDSGVFAVADPVRLRQIIRNLLTNAERYGGPGLEIRLACVGAEALIEVCDDGPGIPPGERDGVFEEWQAADLGIRHPQSIGLGLTISRRLARAMDGDLTYTFADGESRFVLRLPIEANQVAATQL